MYSLDYKKRDNSKIIEKICEVRETGEEYVVLKYDEKFVCDNDETLGAYRSVVYSKGGERLVCYSPPKGLTMDLFQERNKEVSDILITEVVEGTMLSLFWDGGRWELATKGSVGGNYWFYRTQYEGGVAPKQKTFRQMFVEALKGEGDINDLEVIKTLPKGPIEGETYCYNFVLQHPENHIVLEIPYPRVFLVGVYKIGPENNATFIPPTIYQPWFCGANSVIEFPKVVENYDSANIYPSSVPGLMFLNPETGDRSCWENPAYVSLKELRGNHPNLHYQYLCLRRIDKVMDFLKHFPQYKKVFHRFYNQFEEYVTKIHQAYVSYYVRKEGVQIPKKYFVVIHKIHHEVYIPSLSAQVEDADGKKERLIMRRSEVRKALLNLPPSSVFYYLYLDEETK